MTVIAFDGNGVAADKQLTVKDTRVSCTKIYRMAKTNEVLAITGAGYTSIALLEWYKNGAVPADYPENRSRVDGQEDESEATLIVFKPGEHKAYCYDRYPVPDVYEGKRLAFGCGRDFALAAMALGKTARQAVLFTNEHNISCGLGVDYIPLVKPEKPKKKPKKKGKK